MEPTDAENVVLEPLFETIRFPGELTNDHLTTLADFEVRVDGHAIQTTGFATADEAGRPRRADERHPRRPRPRPRRRC